MQTRNATNDTVNDTVNYTGKHTANWADIEAIVGGYHGAPHDILGPHLVSLPSQEETAQVGVAIRVFRPLDEKVFVRLQTSSLLYPLQRVHPAGFFEGVLPDSAPAPYQLIVEDSTGNRHALEDPYRFDFLFTDDDLHLYGEGRLYRSYERFGAQQRQIVVEKHEVTGVNFAVWAPNAQRVSVVGPFNAWDDRVHAMTKRNDGGVWEIFMPNLPIGTEYKFAIASQIQDHRVDKADPYAFYAEKRPAQSSRIWNISNYHWHDEAWVETRADRQTLDQPINIYEVHLGSWRTLPSNPQRDDPDSDHFLSYRDLAHQLVAYVKEMGYTHIELMPLTEHPFDGSWGYQTTGYFAPTSRFGSPDEFKYFVDYCHKHEIGVILDWVPAHFPKDGHGLAFFDGTHLYEHADPRQGEHPDWGTKIFNYGRNEVRNFLLSSALFWIDVYHLDGLRVDAVASMLYLDYGRDSGEWMPNRYGGRENLEAVDFIRQFNTVLHEQHPGVLTFAEESTSWPMVSRPTYIGGLGFDLKWNMGWMHDTLKYMQQDPIHRRYHHNHITFSLLYAFSENFILPFSHDEVVHLKRAMLGKMPGDLWQKFANLRLLYGYMIAHPGKKLLFMGSEFGQWQEWSEARSLDWHLLEQSQVDGSEGNRPVGGKPDENKPKQNHHEQLQHYVAELNAMYRQDPALHQVDFDWQGFEWIDCNDVESSILSFIRYAQEKQKQSDKNQPEDELREHSVIVCNFTPIIRRSYRVGVPYRGIYREVLNSDWQQYGGSGVSNSGDIRVEEMSWQNCPYSVVLDLPPLAVFILKQ
ncbi:MAG: 1,4-alpha-glucan branching protein GlgB [Chloroflexota bacterium]